MKIDKNSVYWRIFGDIWTFFKLHMENTVHDEKLLIEDSKALYKQYESLPEGKFAQELIFSCMREIDRVTHTNTLTSKKEVVFNE